MGGIKLITAPTLTPFTLDEIKTHCRITITEDDAYLESLEAAVVKMVEKVYRLSIMSSTWELALDAPPTTTAIELTPSPLASITSIKSYDELDVETIMATTQYRADTYSQPGRVVLKTDGVWPTGIRTANGIIIRYVSGLYATKAAVESDIKAGLLVVIAGLYERREPVSEVTGQRVITLGGELLMPYRIMRL